MAPVTAIAWNISDLPFPVQIALEEGIDPVTPDDFNLDFWIRDSFIDPSLVELIRQHKCSSNTSTSRARRKWRGRGGSGLGF